MNRGAPLANRLRVADKASILHSCSVNPENSAESRMAATRAPASESFFRVSEKGTTGRAMLVAIQVSPLLL
jgi:hypothetical protein